jgi:hypothetical protein
MEDNYIIGLIIVFLFGFVFFKKDKSTPVNASNAETKSYHKSSATTGVARYLKSHDELASSKESGVEKYLQAKEALYAESSEALAVSGVAKYLANKAQTPVSGVSKYMARQAIHAKKMAKENVSGVEKYLNNRG